MGFQIVSFYVLQYDIVYRLPISLQQIKHHNILYFLQVPAPEFAGLGRQSSTPQLTLVPTARTACSHTAENIRSMQTNFKPTISANQMVHYYSLGVEDYSTVVRGGS